MFAKQAPPKAFRSNLQALRCPDCIIYAQERAITRLPKELNEGYARTDTDTDFEAEELERLSKPPDLWAMNWVWIRLDIFDSHMESAEEPDIPGRGIFSFH